MKSWFYKILQPSLVPTHKTYVSAQMEETVLILSLFFFSFLHFFLDWGQNVYVDITQRLVSSATQNFLNPRYISVNLFPNSNLEEAKPFEHMTIITQR